MDVLLIMLILGAVVVFVTAPLRRAAVAAPVLPAEPSSPGSEVSDLEAARDAKLRELRDAELDHRTGKLSDADYAAVDASLRSEALEILRDLDQAREGLSAGEGQDRSPADTITD